MKNRSKALLLALCALMLVVTTVFTTLAYLTDTKTVTNTFTIGNVAITLTETQTDAYGVALAGDPTPTISAGGTPSGNSYKLIPGRTYLKDPKITLSASSETSYLFVKVVNGITDIDIDTDISEEKKTIANQMAANGWAQLVIDESPVANVYVKNGTATGGETVNVFGNVTIESDAVLTDAHQSATIAITAYAIQADGFTSAEEAWTAAIDSGDFTL